jgi:hypothetical protein
MHCSCENVCVCVKVGKGPVLASRGGPTVIPKLLLLLLLPLLLLALLLLLLLLLVLLPEPGPPVWPGGTRTCQWRSLKPAL